MASEDPGREYVERMRAEGYTDLDIREALADGGWTGEQIERALAPEGAAPPPPPPPREAAPGYERRPERPRERRGTGEGTAVWVIVLVGCLGLMLAVVMVLAAILFPVFARAREKARQASCQANLKQISLAHLMYAQDHDETFVTPPAEWPEKLYPYLKNETVYACPGDDRTSGPMWRGTIIGYTLNGSVAGMQMKGIQSPAQVPLSWDGTQPAGGMGDVEFRHNGGVNCAYVDGHVKWVASSGWSANWTPPAAPAPSTPSSGPPPAPPVAPAPSDEPGEVHSQADAQANACLTNQKQICLAMLMYVEDWDGMAPSGDGWAEGVAPYLGPDPRFVRELYLCPADDAPHRSVIGGLELSYTLNDALSRAVIHGRADRAREVMLFDGSVMAGGAADAEFRHEGSLYAGFADGHVSRVAGAEWEAIWGEQTE